MRISIALSALALLSACAAPQETTASLDTAVAAITPASVAPTPPAEPDAWTAQTITDEMDDTPIIVMATQSTESSGQYNRYKSPSLGIRCTHSETAVFITDVTPAANEYDDNAGVYLRLRFDDAKARGVRWHEGQDNGTFFAPDAVSLAREITKHKLLRVSYGTLMGQESTLAFVLDGATKHVEEVAKTCGWTS